MNLLGHLNAEPWMADAACRDHPNPDLFFADLTDHHIHRTAKTICAECPVTNQCRSYATDKGAEFGVWGGLTAKERGRLEKTQRTPAPPTLAKQCGTIAGAQRHYRRGEGTCPRCRVAATEHRRKSRDNRRNPIGKTA